MALNVERSFGRLNEKIIMHFRSNDESLLIDAKELFSSFIKSNRQLQRVQNIEQLLTMLQRRDIYGPYEFNAFKIFQKIIFDDEFITLVADHQSLLATAQDPISNQYGRIYYKMHNIDASSYYTVLSFFISC
jgi:hypothetical protein